MPSRSSSSTRSSSTLHTIFPACFPSSEGSVPALKVLPDRPRFKEPILDPQSCSVPIRNFDPQAHSAVYLPRQDGVEADLPTAQPAGFSDAYLMPSLTRNERLRLTMLWYHTNGLLEDESFIARLQSIVGLVQTFFQHWEFAIMGFVFEDAFTRVATAGMPLAIVPRRESPCSHTVTQESGRVFFLPDMAKDWRFKAAPTALQGLRGYAGAQLQCEAPGGEVVALGSLCIASNSEQPSLTLTQQDALVRFADMLSAEIINHSREARKRQRNVMARLLAECRLDELEDAETRILDVLRQVYPEASVSFVEDRDGLILLPAHKSIELSDVKEGLWEDTELIDELIITNNHQTLETWCTVRAIVYPVQTHPIVRYVVVASTKIQTVFDDIDAWFVQNCAMSLGKVIQERIFNEALMVKEKFLRGITHQLRTPIHGVLASCELLMEEFSNNKALKEELGSRGATAAIILDAIRDSGKELMTTVNNMLKLNRWAETTVNMKTACPQDWVKFEHDILSEIDQAIPDYERSEVSIFFNNNLVEDESTLSVDIVLLKDCIQSLVLNALQATKQGAVVVSINAAPDRSYLEVDVMDTGCGIAEADQGRIFEAYEKVDIHSRGAGLGLTLATNIAKLMHGNVTLIRSSQAEREHGSLFRATVATPSLVIPAAITPLTSPLPKAPRNGEPIAFHRVHHPGQCDDLNLHFTKYLEQRGFNPCKPGRNTITLLPYISDPDEFEKLAAANRAKMLICLIPTRATPTHLQNCQQGRLRTFTGPFTSLRLNQILKDIRQTWESLQRKGSSADPELTPTTNGNGTASPGLEPPPSPADSIPHALLVDDNMVNLKIMRMYCEKRKIAHTTATNGREAVDAFKASLLAGALPLNLILMDLQMPVCDGVDATHEIREIEKTALAAQHPPSRIFMVTGQDSLADKERSFAAGADEFYVKPMGMKKLDAGIGAHFPSFGKRLGAAKK